MYVFVEFIGAFLPAIFAQPREASVPDDGEEPAATVASAKRAETSPGPERRFLDHIFSVRGASQEPAGEVMRRMEMRKDQVLESSKIDRLFQSCGLSRNIRLARPSKRRFYS